SAEISDMPSGSAETTMIGTLDVSRTRRHSSMPSTIGISRSVRIIAGWVTRSSASAASASPATRTSYRPPSTPGRWLAACGSSATTSTLTLIASPLRFADDMDRLRGLVAIGLRVMDVHAVAAELLEHRQRDLAAALTDARARREQELHRAGRGGHRQ